MVESNIFHVFVWSGFTAGMYNRLFKPGSNNCLSLVPSGPIRASTRTDRLNIKHEWGTRAVGGLQIVSFKTTQLNCEMDGMISKHWKGSKASHMMERVLMNDFFLNMKNNILMMISYKSYTISPQQVSGRVPTRVTKHIVAQDRHLKLKCKVLWTLHCQSLRLNTHLLYSWIGIVIHSCSCILGHILLKRHPRGMKMIRYRKLLLIYASSCILPYT